MGLLLKVETDEQIFNEAILNQLTFYVGALPFTLAYFGLVLKAAIKVLYEPKDTNASHTIIDVSVGDSEDQSRVEFQTEMQDLALDLDNQRLDNTMQKHQ